MSTEKARTAWCEHSLWRNRTGMNESNICNRKVMRVEDKTNVISSSALAVALGMIQEVLGASSSQAAQDSCRGCGPAAVTVGQLWVSQGIAKPVPGMWRWWSGQMAPWGMRPKSPVKETDRMTQVHILFFTLGHNFGSIW